ncbi:permease [uncultured Pseudoteredinibacter sp.]|uniref:permease n=1 Tax=uncultured Pseudoteredinibacter sp. TaxID=1641701 RepID=UPI002617EA60|nr:permease [uncultured Pseudoteredinibacter sp.]
MMTQSAIAASLEMFVFLVAELTLLFLVVSYAVAYLQTRLPPQKIQDILGAKQGKGYFFAALLGSITPFCSCSTIPFLKGLLRAKAGFGTMMVFLFASPLLNPIIIALFFATFGASVTLFYFVMAMGVSLIAGIALEAMGFERYIKAQSYEAPSSNSCSQTCGQEVQKQSLWRELWESTWQDFKTVLPYLMAGIAIGSVIYGFMPTEWVAKFASAENPFAIPVAAIIGIPLYIRAEAVIPLSAVLVTKGMGFGAIMALIIGSAGASLTEVILLKSIFKSPLIVAFLLVIVSMAIISGFLYGMIF